MAGKVQQYGSWVSLSRTDREALEQLVARVDLLTDFVKRVVLLAPEKRPPESVTAARQRARDEARQRALRRAAKAR